MPFRSVTCPNTFWGCKTILWGESHPEAREGGSLSVLGSHSQWCQRRPRYPRAWGTRPPGGKRGPMHPTTRPECPARPRGPRTSLGLLLHRAGRQLGEAPSGGLTCKRACGRAPGSSSARPPSARAPRKRKWAPGSGAGDGAPDPQNPSACSARPRVAAPRQRLSRPARLAPQREDPDAPGTPRRSGPQPRSGTSEGRGRGEA